jgi:hypothetical protein
LELFYRFKVSDAFFHEINYSIRLYLAIILHATLRTRNLANKVANKIDQLSLQSTPMGIFLAALGLRSSAFTE